MAHNQEMLEHHAATWGDKVRIIGISIDQTAAAVVKHVTAKGWTKVEHFHRAGSSCDDDYGVKGVPHVVLIDTNGKIAFIGHPASMDLEKGIEKLLKGESLGAGAGGDDDEDEGGSYTELDVNALRTEMDTFEQKVGDLAKNTELQSAAATLQRDFVVLIRQTRYDPDADKFLSNYENINVLVGSGASIEKAKTQIQNFLTSVGGTFKTTWRT